MKQVFLLWFFTAFGFFSQAQTARVKGVILDEFNSPIENVTVRVGDKGTVTNANGFYLLEIPANTKVSVTFSHVSFKKTTVEITLKPNEDYELNPVLSSKVEQIGEVTVTGSNKKRIEGLTVIDPVIIRRIPGANAGIENIIKTLPGVYSNNELSTSYAVRGGNYDDNLVYVNEIEVYRPFLIRSGQQEGLSFTNTDMVAAVDFSAGGFQSKYGDKMASVLDITYRNPKRFGASLEASLLGGSLTVEGNVTSVNTTNVEIADKLIELAKVTSPSNATANGGGISIEGGTDGDKTLIWTTTGSTWASSENFNLAINKAYRINGFDVLSQTSLGTTVASAPGLTSVGTLTSLQVSNLSVNGITISSTLVNSNIILSPNGSGTISMNNAKISNLGTPTDPAHGANKSYVDYTVRIAPLGLSADTTGLTPAQIATSILAKIFPATDHESGTILRLICTDKPESGTDLNSRYKQFNLTPTVGTTKEWQYGGSL